MRSSRIASQWRFSAGREMICWPRILWCTREPAGCLFSRNYHPVKCKLMLITIIAVLVVAATDQNTASRAMGAS